MGNKKTNSTGSTSPGQIKTQKGIALWKRAKKLIPGGNQLLSKRSEMFLPEKWPSYYKKAKGCRIWDLDGNTYLDFSIMGIGACTLGYADPDVDKAVKKAIDAGSMSTLNSPEEVELTELLTKLHPWADMARYARTGGEAMAIAIRIARAASGEDKVAFCGYHGWSDWYLATNLAYNKNLDGHLLPGLAPRGVPRGLRETTIPFHYNNIEELKKIVKKYKIGVIVMEPLRHHEPKANFLKEVRKIANRIGAVLIFDEISVGWRLTLGGAHLCYGTNPDIAVFAKAISNGYPMGAIIGKRKVMQAAQDTFISSTYWTERIGPTAALATIKKMQRVRLQRKLDKKGKMIRTGLNRLAKKHGLRLNQLSEIAPMIIFAFDYGKNSQKVRTLFVQEMLRRGFIATNAVYVSYAHTEPQIKRYLATVDEVFALLKDAIEKNRVRKLLEGPVAHTGFQRLT